MIASASVQRVRFTVPSRWNDGDPENLPGDLVTMPDGSEWFHPYSGGAPVKITDQNRHGLSQ